MRVAFASTGDAVDQHFGSARHWQVYDIDESGGVFVEQRKSQAKCHGHCEGGFAHLLELLNDCGAIFAVKIGGTAAAFMRQNGKRVFEARGALEEIIEELSNGDFL
jgi:predicted Fe-Mo cluster-binding NifX family protein